MANTRRFHNTAHPPAIPPKTSNARATTRPSQSIHPRIYNNPFVIETDSENGETAIPRSESKKERHYVNMEGLNKEEEEFPMPKRKPGRSTYCKPTSRKPTVRDIQEFMVDNESDNESAGSFDHTDSDSGSSSSSGSNSDENNQAERDIEVINNELEDLDIDMSGWNDNARNILRLGKGAGNRLSSQRKLKLAQRSAQDASINNGSFKHKPNGSSSTKQKRPQPTGTCRKLSTCDNFAALDTRLTDDEEDFTAYASKSAKKTPVSSHKQSAASSIASKKCRVDRDGSGYAFKSHQKTTPRLPKSVKSTQAYANFSTPPPSPTPSLLSFDFDLDRYRNVPRLSIKLSGRRLRYRSRRKR